VPPGSQLGPITPSERTQLIKNSIVAGTYEKVVDRDSAFEMLKARAASAPPAASAGNAGAAAPAPANGGIMGGLGDILFGSTGPRGGRREGMVEAMSKSAARSVGSSIAREITRGVLGSILGGTRRRR
jgi:hypothetical protein